MARSSRAPPQVDGGHSQALENGRDSRELTGIQETDAPSVGLSDFEGRSYNQQLALIASFGYFEDSTSNTMALLRRVSATILLFTWNMFWKLIRVPSGVRTV